VTRIACCQLAPRVGDLDGNRGLALAAVRAAVTAGAEVVVLPELVTSGYVFSSAAEAAALAVPADGPLLAGWSEAGAGAVVVGGFCELGEDGRVFNSAAVVDGSGVRAVYRKTHLWDREKLFFTPGEHLPPVVDTAVGRVGVAICYDLEFPELTRSLALAGADLVAVPTNWPLGPRPEGERPPEVVIAMAAARVNRVAFACCDRSGTERGQRWTEGSAVVDADGWVVAGPVAGTGTLLADVDLRRAREKALTDLAHCLDDRRPRLYAPVTAEPAGNHRGNL
jgi:predicted amidohydrolase